MGVAARKTIMQRYEAGVTGQAFLIFTMNCLHGIGVEKSGNVGMAIAIALTV